MRRFPAPPSPIARRQAANEYGELLIVEAAELRLIERLRHILAAAHVRRVEVQARLAALRAIFAGYYEGAP